MFLIYLITFFILIPIGIIVLVFLFLKKVLNIRIAKIVSLFLIISYFLALPLYLYFEDYFYTKNDIYIELYKEGIYLKNNNFEVISNKSGGFTDYYHNFEIKLSDENYNFLTSNLSQSDEVLTLTDYEKNNCFTMIKVNTKTKILTYDYFEP